MLSARRILLTTDAVGGVWRYTMELAAGLRALGATVQVVSLGPPPSRAQRREAGDSLTVTSLPLDWLAGSAAEIATAAQDIAALARAWGADSVHLHAPALACGALSPAPVVAVAHSCVGTWWRAMRGETPIPRDLAWRSRLVGEGLRIVDAAIAPSASFAQELAACYGRDCAIAVVRNGRRPLVAPALPRRGVLTAGRLWDESKNVAMLDAAAAQLDVPVFAAGPIDGPNGTRIEFRHLRSLGALDEIALGQAYAQAAVFVSVARYEPFGLAVLEAAQAGCALVLSDIPSFRELWGGAALFVDPGDAAAIAETINAAMGDCAERGRAARRHARFFTRDAMAAATLALHQQLEFA